MKKFLDVFKAIIPSADFAAADIDNMVMKRTENYLSADIILPYPISEDKQKCFADEVKSIYRIANIDFSFKFPTAPKVAAPSVHGAPIPAAAPKQEENKSPLIYGKGIPADAMVEKIANIDEYYGRAVIEGKVIATDERETKTGKIIFRFDITDKTSSISVKMFLDPKKKNLAPKDRIKEGTCLRVRGDAKYDQFDREVGMMASDIVEIKLPEKQDNAPEKRVELHLHTKMSAMDAVIETDDVVKRAAQWGHKAIAITDHGVVQSFPDAYDAGNKYGIKIIYGTECYLIDDGVKIVDGDCNEPFSGTFVAFDIETTGLSPLNAEIIEIGAVRIENGAVTETFDEFVNPGFEISEFTTNLTGITNEMLEGQKNLDEVLPKFLEFIGDAPLIAHNAPFDCGFISYACEKRGLKFTNAAIDTLSMARSMEPKHNKYTLDAVAGWYKIDMGSHHRANDDANTCGEIFLKFAERLQKENIKHVGELNEKVAAFDFTKQKMYHCIILVKTQAGMKNLFRIISESHINYFHRKPRVPRSLLERNREGLIVGSACEAGELYRAIVDGKPREKLLEIAKFYDYLEIQPLGNNRFMLDKGIVDSMEQLIEYNKLIVDLAKEQGKPYVATCDAHFLDPEDSIFRSIIQAGQGYDDADNQAPLYFRTTDEMLAEFEYLDEETRKKAVITYPNEVADWVEADLHPIPKKQYAPSIEGAEDDVRNISEARAKEIYGENLPDLVRERMEKEFHSIIDNGFSVMYVIAQKLVWDSLDHGYLVGSRGSVGSSFVAFLMKITEVNALIPHYICPKCKNVEWITDGSVGCGMDLPDKICPKCGEKYYKDGHDIPFETFLGFYGDKDPDIDLNFSGEYQSESHRYTEKIFGHDHVFKAGTISGLAEKTAWGYVANYLKERNRVLPRAEMERLKMGCEGVKKTTGQHPGGMVVVPADMDILDFCPINRPADKKDCDFITTHFDYNKMKGTLLKFDILGHDDPTVLKMLGDLTGVDVTKIPLDDQDVMSLFTSTKALHYKPEYLEGETFLDNVGTYAIPEFGTSFVRQMLADTKPSTFSELVRISGLSHGTNVWLNNAQDLVRDGTATLKEVICTRDDIMTTLIRWGVENKKAFDIMEFTRKGKFKQHMDMIPVMQESGVPQWYIDSCLKISYMFPKAHAAAYVTMAFRIAWFKVHYPEAFYQAYFTVRADEFDAALMTRGIEEVRKNIYDMKHRSEKLSAKENNTLTILEVCNEMYSRGYTFVPIDLYASDATKFLKTDKGILPPLNALAGLGENAAKAIAEARKDGEFMTIDDLRVRSGINKTAIEMLRQEGCLNGMRESSQLTFF